MLGTVGAGKSTVAAAVFLTAQTLSSDNPSFYGEVVESNSDILTDVSNLRRGRFPSKTAAFQRMPVESGLVLTWETLGGLRKRQIQIPICDIAGEDVQQMIRQTRMHLSPEDFNTSTQLLNYVRDATGFILCVPASRALLFHDDVQLEAEPAGETDVVDPDVPINRILNDVIQYKAKSSGKAIEAIAVIITKWDIIENYALNWGMDLYDGTGEGLNKFMKICFPGTLMTLKKYLDDSRVRFFPSHFQVKKDSENKVEKWPDGGDRINVIQGRRVPRYSEQSYVNLFAWLRSFAT